MMIGFDDVLNNYIKMGMYQTQTIMVVGLIEFCDGIEFAFMSIMMAIFQKEWNLGQAEVASLGAIYFLGIVIGNYFCAFVTDTIGRKLTLSIFSGIAVILVVYTSFVTSYSEIMWLRLFFGAVFGVAQPLGYIFITEVVVSEYRGRYGLALTLLYVLGKLYLVCLCFYFLQDYTTGNWRGLIRFNSIPAGCCFLGAVFVLKETIRFQITKGNYSQAFAQIENAAQLNHAIEYQPLSQEQKDGMISWQIRQVKNQKLSKVHFKGLFGPLYIGITIRLWIILVCANLQNMSIFLLMPFLFNHKGEGFSSMFWLYVTEFVASWVIYLVIDNPRFGGRVRVIIGASVLLVCCNLALLYWREKALFAGLLLIKVATRGLFSTSYILACESYSAGYRSLGSGCSQGVGRFAGIPAPYIMFPLFYIDPYLPFLFNSVVAMILLLTSVTYPIDKTQRPLESTNTSIPVQSVKLEEEDKLE